jgi:hypothetical protein
MFGQNSILNTTDFDRVLEILALVGDPVQTKSKVTHARALAEAFETLAKHQTELAREREAHARPGCRQGKGTRGAGR